MKTGNMKRYDVLLDGDCIIQPAPITNIFKYIVVIGRGNEIVKPM